MGLAIIAWVLFFVLMFINYFFVDNKRGYFRSTAVNIDRFANREYRAMWNKLLRLENGHPFGDIAETLSYALGKNQHENTLSKTGKVLCAILNWIDKDHCKKAYLGISHKTKKQTYMEKLAKLFIDKKGWQHFVAFIAIGVLIPHIALTNNGVYEKTLFDTMFKSLYDLTVIPILFFTGFGSFVIGFFIEGIQGLVRKTELSWSDIFFGVSGIYFGQLIGVCLYASTVVAIIAYIILVLSVLVFLQQLLIPNFRIFIVRQLALSYRKKIFGRYYNTLRAVRWFMPTMLVNIVVGIINYMNGDFSNPGFYTWNVYGLSLIVAYFVFINFRFFPVKWEELDNYQKFMYGKYNHSKLTDSQREEFYKLSQIYN